MFLTTGLTYRIFVWSHSTRVKALKFVEQTISLLLEPHGLRHPKLWSQHFSSPPRHWVFHIIESKSELCYHLPIWSSWWCFQPPKVFSWFLHFRHTPIWTHSEACSSGQRKAWDFIVLLWPNHQELSFNWQAFECVDDKCHFTDCWKLFCSCIH